MQNNKWYRYVEKGHVCQILHIYIQIICGINIFEVQKLHPMNKRYFYITIFVKPL